MKIAIISDIHENFHNLISFIQEIENKDIEKIICLGDLINNGIAKTLAHLDVPVIAIWGNNDGDRVAITKTAMEKGSNLSVSFDTYDIIQIKDKKIFITHYPLLVKSMAKSGDVHAIFYGHNHQKNIESINDCCIVNPGEISAHKTNEASYAIYDTIQNSAELFTIQDSISINTDKVKAYRNKRKQTFGESKAHQY